MRRQCPVSKKRSVDSPHLFSLGFQFRKNGPSFDAAEEILKNAGFTVSPRPGPNPVGNRPDRYSVVAAISPLESSFPKKTDVYVFLTPKNHGDYTSGIAEISAKITISFV